MTRPGVHQLRAFACRGRRRDAIRQSRVIVSLSRRSPFAGPVSSIDDVDDSRRGPAWAEIAGVPRLTARPFPQNRGGSYVTPPEFAARDVPRTSLASVIGSGPAIVCDGTGDRTALSGPREALGQLGPCKRRRRRPRAHFNVDRTRKHRRPPCFPARWACHPPQQTRRRAAHVNVSDSEAACCATQTAPDTPHTGAHQKVHRNPRRPRRRRPRPNGECAAAPCSWSLELPLQFAE